MLDDVCFLYGTICPASCLLVSEVYNILLGYFGTSLQMKLQLFREVVKNECCFYQFVIFTFALYIETQ